MDDFLDGVEIGFRFEGVVDAVVTGFEESAVVHFGVVTEVGETGGFDQAVSHERTGGNNGADNSGFDQVAENQTHFGDGECAGKSQDHEAIFIAGHGFEDVGGIAYLAASESGLAHGANHSVHRARLGKIKRVNRLQVIGDRIVEDSAGSSLFLCHSSPSQVM